MTRQIPPSPDRPADIPPGERGEHNTEAIRQQVTAAMQSAAAYAERLYSTTRTAIAREKTRNPRRFRIGVICAVVVGILSVLFLFQSLSPREPQQISADTRRYFVSGQPVLVFDRRIGSVHIVPGPDGQVTIKEVDNGITDAITTHYAQQGNKITVAVDIQDGLMLDTWADFEVRVPQHSGFTASVATGTLDATGLSGNIALNGTNGSIWATHLTGTTRLITQSGSINLTNVKGQVTALTQNGTITTTDTELDGRSSMKADGGTINFHGRLSRTGRSLFENTNGAVGLTIPANTAFALTAQTAGGSINSDFKSLAIKQRTGGNQASGAIGSGERAQLTIHTSSGSISIFQGV